MALLQSRQIRAGVPTTHPSAGNAAVPQMADFVFATNPAINDVIEMLGVSAAMLPIDCLAYFEDIDTGALLSVDCGIISGVFGAALMPDNVTQRTCGNEFFAGSTSGQAGGLQRMNKVNACFQVPTQEVIPIGFKIVAAAAGIVVGSRLRLVVLSMPVPQLV